MSEKRQPWMKWYPADWRQEPTLRMCSRAARSLWHDMLGLMHEAEPYGHLILSGQVLAAKQLAAVLGDREKDVVKWLAELDHARVYSVDAQGRIYSRRMIRDKDKADRDRENGKSGGNPVLVGEVNDRVNPPDKAQKPETRSQKPEKECAGDFEGWWAIFPRHVAKGAARKAYAAALKKTDAATLLAAVARAAERYAQTEPRFVPHGATWLLDERWLDEHPAPVKATPAATDDRWEPRLRSYRSDLDAGKSRPFWDDFWGPKPGQAHCGAPPEMLERYGFMVRAA